MATSRRVNTRE